MQDVDYLKEKINNQINTEAYAPHFRRPSLKILELKDS